ncbi:Rho GTPase-activating protein 29 [Triplophysa tibetana]|uniref:Rho GTPase-activating protein 29 n=1 Tax=Triplophysa tibetana TaxID=1572043 RepID=A0A5A9PD46_9TELE|nr:Rho GTPase-activating protein 29 [Triplophysa tibetana]
MFRQGSNSGNKRMTGGARLSHPNVVPLAVCSNKTQDMGRSSKTNPLNAMGLDHAITPPGGDPEYIMQLVNDVRKFSDALLSLEEAFQYRASMWVNCLSPRKAECLYAVLVFIILITGGVPRLSGCHGTKIDRTGDDQLCL